MNKLVLCTRRAEAVLLLLAEQLVTNTAGPLCTGRLGLLSYSPAVLYQQYLSLTYILWFCVECTRARVCVKI